MSARPGPAPVGPGPACHHQSESSRLSIALMWARAHASQKYWRVPFSTEQSQVGGGPSLSAVASQRAHRTRSAAGSAG